jgi:hypothetical protein
VSRITGSERLLRDRQGRSILVGVSKAGSLRASDADREQVVSRLHQAATEGRIAAEELEQRVSTALKARTYGELEATVADLPQPRQRRQPTRSPTGHWVLATVRANPFLLVFAIPVLALTFAMLLAATIVWMVLMVIVLLVGGGRRRPPRGPWMYTRYRRAYGPPRRGARSYWA